MATKPSSFAPPVGITTECDLCARVDTKSVVPCTKSEDDDQLPSIQRSTVIFSPLVTLFNGWSSLARLFAFSFAGKPPCAGIH